MYRSGMLRMLSATQVYGPPKIIGDVIGWDEVILMVETGSLG